MLQDIWAASSPLWTFEPDAVGTLLQTQKIPSNFREADIARRPIGYGNAAPRSTVNEAQVVALEDERRARSYLADTLLAEPWCCCLLP